MALTLERLTDEAREVVLAAQDEARAYQHDYIGPEHMLLALMRQPDSSAVRALDALGVHTEQAGQRVVKVIGTGETPTVGQIPFTPAAITALELAGREARAPYNAIDTHHLLLGLVGEGEGVAARVLLDLGVDVQRIWQSVKKIRGETNENDPD